MKKALITIAIRAISFYIWRYTVIWCWNIK